MHPDAPKAYYLWDARFPGEHNTIVIVNSRAEARNHPFWRERSTPKQHRKFLRDPEFDPWWPAFFCYVDHPNPTYVVIRAKNRVAAKHHEFFKGTPWKDRRVSRCRNGDGPKDINGILPFVGIRGTLDWLEKHHPEVCDEPKQK